MARETVVIVGANLAGGAATSTLREEGFEGRIVLIGAELHPPYERPPLSKQYLRGEEPFDKCLLRQPDWYEQNGVELLLGRRAHRVDPVGRAVELEDGERIPFDQVLIATGGRNRRLTAPGAELEGIHSLRTVEDCDAIRSDAKPGSKAVIVGAGFIGSEVGASLRSVGVEVDVIDPGSLPLMRVLGVEVARLYADIHTEHGVRFHFGERIGGFEGNGRVEAVVTAEGARIECDFVVVGVGIEPVAEVVAGTGVEVDNGILVDERCRTNVPGVYAAGDVANHWHPVFGRRMRVEHWDNALKQGTAAARNMMGAGAPFDDPHWFWSDQYEYNLQYAGHAVAWDEFVVRGSLEDRSFVGFYLKDGLVEGVVGVNRGRDVRRSMRLVKARRPVDPRQLRDEAVDLKTVAAQMASEGEEA